MGVRFFARAILGCVGVLFGSLATMAALALFGVDLAPQLLIIPVFAICAAVWLATALLGLEFIKRMTK